MRFGKTTLITVYGVIKGDLLFSNAGILQMFKGEQMIQDGKRKFFNIIQRSDGTWWCLDTTDE